MSERSLLIEGLIRLHLEGKGAQEAEASMKHIIESSRQVAKELGGIDQAVKNNAAGVGTLDKSFQSLGRTVATFFGAQAVSGFLKDSYTGFAQTERQARAVETQIALLGKSAGGTAEEFRAFIRNLSDASGIVDDEIVPAFQRALLTFNDYRQAQEVTQIAAKFAAAGIGDVASNVERISAVFQTGSTKALREFGIVTKDLAGDTVDVSEAMRLLIEQAGKLPAGLDDAQSRINSFRNAIDNWKDSLGQSLDWLVQKAQWVGKGVADALEIITDPEGYQKRKAGEAEIAFAEMLRTMGPTKDQAGPSSLQAAANKRTADAARKAGEDAAKAFADGYKAIGPSELDAAVKETALVFESPDALAALYEEYQKQAEAQKQADARLLQLRKDNTVEGTKERMRLETEIELAALDESITAILSKLQDGDERKTQLAKEYAKRRAKIVQDESNAEARIDAATAANKAAGYLGLAGQVAGAVAQVFEQNKAAQYAETIINTATAIMKTYAEYGWSPYGIAAAAAAAATGAAQLAVISRTRIGSGGGGDFGGGASAVPGGRPTGSQTATIAPVSPAQLSAIAGSGAVDAPITIKIDNAFGDDASMRLLSRKIVKAIRTDPTRLR